MDNHLRLVVDNKKGDWSSYDCDFEIGNGRKKQCLNCSSLDECLRSRTIVKLEEAIQKADLISTKWDFPRFCTEIQKVLEEGKRFSEKIKSRQAK